MDLKPPREGCILCRPSGEVKLNLPWLKEPVSFVFNNIVASFPQF
jgi:hypothetical protein